MSQKLFITDSLDKQLNKADSKIQKGFRKFFKLSTELTIRNEWLINSYKIHKIDGRLWELHLFNNSKELGDLLLFFTIEKDTVSFISLGYHKDIDRFKNLYASDKLEKEDIQFAVGNYNL